MIASLFEANAAVYSELRGVRNVTAERQEFVDRIGVAASVIAVLGLASSVISNNTDGWFWGTFSLADQKALLAVAAAVCCLKIGLYLQRRAG